MDGSIRFRFAGREDIPLILRFIKELADYEGMLDQVVATEELLDQWLFEMQKAEVLLGSCGGETVGLSLIHILRMEQCVKDAGCPGRLIPVPRQISAGCGMALCAPAADRVRLESLIQENGIETEGIHDLFL